MKLLAICLTLLLLPGGGQTARTLEDEFLNPPQSYGIRCWWWWLNGNVTKEVITRDLEEMKAKGFSGACIFDAGGANQRDNLQVPEGPMFGSPEWRELYKHAIKEADRLGLVLSLNIQSGWNLGGPDVAPVEATKHLTWVEVHAHGPATYNQRLPQPTTRDGFYKDIALLAFPARSISHAPIRDLEYKAAFKEVAISAPDTRYLLSDVPALAGEEDVRSGEIVDLTNKLSGDGVLSWNVPSGDWTLLRFGYTPSGAQVSTSSGKWQGRVIDYMSEKYFMRYWNTHVEPLMRDIGPMAGKTLRYLQTDSWELGGINWTDNFAAEFRQRRSYDVIAYLPVIAGKIVDGRDQSNRFLADFRKTISDLIAERHYAVFAREAKKHGMGIQPESAGPHAGPFDGLKNYGYSEIPMGEFWVPSPHRPTPERRFFVKMAASAAHVYDRRLVGAEAFTSIGPHWNDTLWSSQKPSFDHEVCAGLNLTLLHTFTASPKEMGKPGQEYFAGTHFNPNVTWWDMAAEPIRYFTRCQFLMQQGNSVADVLYYYGDHVPNIARLKEDDPARSLPGYDYDIIDEDVLVSRLTVKDGRISLPRGRSYRLLVLPDHKALSLAALKIVRKLVGDGATVLGPKPERTASLTGYPASEDEMRRLADELWGTSSVSAEHRVGRGRIISGKTARDVLRADGVLPDFDSRQSGFDYIHQTLGDTEYYFVSNQHAEAQRVECAVRQTGKQPEIWDPLTGKMWNARTFSDVEGRTSVPLEFAPYGSLFIVFRKPIESRGQSGRASNFPTHKPFLMLDGPWEVRFDPKWGGPEQVIFDRLRSWTTRPEEGIRFYSGTAVYRIVFDSASIPPAASRLALTLGDVRDIGIARIRLNGRDLGITWTPPFQVDIREPLKPSGNILEVEVVNSWRNRLIGDKDRPERTRFTKTNITVAKDWTLVDSGLFGPVQVLAVSE